jgi:hypothetical protein
MHVAVQVQQIPANKTTIIHPAAADEVTASLNRRMAHGLTPGEHTPVGAELFNDDLVGVFVELAAAPPGYAYNPWWVKARMSPPITYLSRPVNYSAGYVTKTHTDILAASMVDIMKFFPFIPDNGLGTTLQLVVGIADTYEHWDTMSLKEIRVSSFNKFFDVANFIAKRTIPAYEGWPSHLVTFGIMTAEHIYLVRDKKRDDADAGVRPNILCRWRTRLGLSRDA